MSKSVARSLRSLLISESSLPDRGRVLLNAGVQFAGKGATMLAGVLLIGILTRYLGLRGFGQYTFVTGYVSFFAVITDLGSQAIAVRDMASDARRAPAVATQLFLIKTATALLAAAASLLLAFSLPLPSLKEPGVVIAITVASLGLLSAPFGGTGSAIFQTRVQMRVPVAADVASRLLVLGAVAVLGAGLVLPITASGSRLAAVVLIGTLAGVFSSGFIYLNASRIIRVDPLAYHRELFVPMVRNALPLALVLVVGMVHYRIDVLILTAMKGTSAVGQYGVATKLLDVSLAVSAMFIGVAFPVLSSRVHGEAALLRRAVQKSLEFMLIVGMGIGVFACVLAPLIVPLIGGSAFSGAVLPLAVIAWAVPIMFANQLFSNMVVAANRQMAAVPIVLAAASVNVVLNVLLIPSMGALGPALVTDVSEAISALGIGILMVRTYGFTPSAALPARIVVSAGVAAVVLVVTRPLGLIPCAAAGAIVYGLALYLTRTVQLSDVTTLLRKEVPA